MFDSNLMFRTSTDGDLTADEADLTIVDVGKGGLPKRGITARVVVPEAGGSSPTLDITFKAGASSPPTAVKHTMPQISAAGVYEHRLEGDYRYWRMVTDVEGTSPDFGAVIAGIIND